MTDQKNQMRVVLKPAGLAIVLCGFAVLSWIVATLNQRLKQREYDLPPPGAMTSPSPAASKTLVNGGFEENYTKAEPYDSKAILSGMVAAPWHDDSSWAQVTVDYAQEKESVHGGQSCQKVVVSNVVPNTDSRVQFVQAVALEKGKKYRAKVWLRAEQETAIEIALRQAPTPFRYYGSNTFKVGPKWQQVEVTGTVVNDGDTFLMLKVSKPVTFWVDDASLMAEANP